MPTDETKAEETKSEPGRLQDRRILIVDDDPDIRESFEAALQSEGALTQVAPDGNEAIRIVSEDPPELVVLDMMLPRRSGFLVLEKIKGWDDSPAVIMVTANEGKRHQAYAESLGVDRYLQKPVPLIKLITTAIELLALRDDLMEDDPDAPDEPDGASEEPNGDGSQTQEPD